MEIKQKYFLNENDIKEAIINHVNGASGIFNKKLSVVLKTEPIYGYGDVHIGNSVSAEVTVPLNKEKDHAER